MKKYNLLVAVLLMTLFVLASCAPSARVPVTRPAEINLVGIKRLAIGDIEGNSGTAISDMLSQRLFESGHYEVLDRQNINALMREHNLNLSGAVDESSAPQIGELLGASALIFGRSNAQYRVSRKTSKLYYDKNNQPYRYYSRIGEAKINTTLKVVDMTTGKIIAIKNFSEASSDRNQERNQWPPHPDRDMVVGEAMNKTVGKFMKMIAPYTEYVRVEFADSKIPEVKAGIVSAQSGQWDSAELQFKNAVDGNPSDPAAWYNLGLAYMYTHQFDKAINAFNRSNGIKPSAKCAQEIAKCRKLESDKRKLDLQTEGR